MPNIGGKSVLAQCELSKTRSEGNDASPTLGVDRLSVPILSILPIIDIGHFKNRFADNNFFFFFFMQTNILFTGDIIN